MTRKWLLLPGAAMVLTCAVLARGVAFSSDPTAHFPKDSPNVVAWLELSLRFDAFNTLIVGLEEPVAPLISVERVKRITDRLAALKANGVLALASVTNVESIHEGADGSLETELLISALPENKAALDALSRKIADDPQVSGALISRDQRGYVVVIRADPRRESARLAQAVRRVVEEERGPLVATYFGAPFFQDAMTRAVSAELNWLVPVGALLFLAVLGLMVRNLRAIAWVLGCAVLCLVVWLGAVRLVGVVLTATSATAAILLFVVAALAFARALETGLSFPRLAAVGLGCLALLSIGHLSTLAVAMAVGAVAIALVGYFVFDPLATPLGASRVVARISGATGLMIAAAALMASVLVARQARFHGTPQTLFSPRDDVGSSLSFFDRRFGGPDFIQVDFRGDLRDPEIAARLLRLTDFLEGPAAFGDVRAVAPILGFLNHGFGGIHRIPTSRESLNNLWFFLEGRPDVRNLVSDKRDEAMVLLRVPSRLPRPMSAFVEIVDSAIGGSLEQGRASTKLRLNALAATFALPTTRVDSMLDGPVPDANEAVNAGIRKWLASGDSPFQPSDAQWQQLKLALGQTDRVQSLTAVASSFAELADPHQAAQLVDSVLAREKDLRLSLRALALVDLLWEEAPAAARVRAQGILADHLDPHAGSGVGASVTVTGLPIVAQQVERDVLAALWRALGLLVGVGSIGLFALTRDFRATARATVEAALAAVMTFALAGALGLGVDPGSLPLFLLPPLAAFVVSGSSRLPSAFAVALAAGSSALLFVGVLPVSRIGATLAIGLATVALIHALSRQVASPVAVR